MWIWIIIIAIIIGAAIAYFNGDGNIDDAVAGGCMGGYMAGNCLAYLAIAALSIFLIIWLFNFIFG